MFVSAELRWFAEGAPPPEVTDWFGNLGPDGLMAIEDERIDRYVVPASPDEPGVKLRDLKPDAPEKPPSLEVKQRTRTLERSPVASGRAEAWRKWSFPLPGPDVDTAGWVDVRKARRMWKFAVAEDGAVDAVAPSGRPEVGANVELSALGIGGRPWWSVCAEAFGPDEGAAARALDAVAARVFASGVPPALAAAASMGYPAWLRGVAGEGGG
jgi:hypothetical protein